ncbi:MAG: extracellular solute-binding protein [Nitriliruptoraceae bacterium]
MTISIRRSLVAVAAGALVLAACGGDGDGDAGLDELGLDEPADEEAEDDAGEEAEDEGGEALPDAGDADLQLLGWSASPAENEALEEVLAGWPEGEAALTLSSDFEATLRASLAAGDPADVFYVDSSRFPDLAGEAVLEPIGDRLDDPDDFYEPLREAFTYEGELYCPPKDFSILALQYNVEMFEEAGLEPPTTWEELASVAEELTTDERAGIVLGPELARLGIFLHQAGGSVLTEDETSNILSEESLEGLRFIEQMFSEGWAATPAELDAGWAGEAFGQERAAMTIEGNWIIGAMSGEFPDVEYEAVPLPMGPESNTAYAFTVCYGVAADSEDAEVAASLADYLTSTDAMLDFTLDFPVIPSRESAREEWVAANPGTEAYLEAADDAISWQFPTGFTPALDEINSVLQGMADGSIDAATAAERIDAAVTDVLG